MKEFWVKVFLILAALTSISMIFYWYVIYDPLARAILMIVNLIFAVGFIMAASRLVNKK